MERYKPDLPVGKIILKILQKNMEYREQLVSAWEPLLQQSTSGLFIFLIQRPKQEQTCKSKANKTPTGGKKGKKGKKYRIEKG